MSNHTIWKHFDKTPEVHRTKHGKRTNYYKVICKHCKKEYEDYLKKMEDESSSNGKDIEEVPEPVKHIGRHDKMIPHILKTCPNIDDDARQKVAEQVNSSTPSNGSKSQGRRGSFTSNSGKRGLPSPAPSNGSKSQGRRGSFSSKCGKRGLPSPAQLDAELCQDLGITVDQLNAIREAEAQSTRKIRGVQRVPLNNSVVPKLTNKQVAEFERRLIILLADAAIPFAVVERESFVDIIRLLRSSAVDILPTRRQLAGRILNAAYDSAKERSWTEQSAMLKAHYYCHLSTNGWKDVSDKHLVGSTLSIGELKTIFDIEDEGANHNGIAVSKCLESLINRANERTGFKLAGLTSDDTPQYGRARRICALRFPTLVFLKCWAHQLNLMMKHVLSDTAFSSVSAKVIKITAQLSKSSSKNLVLARQAMQRVYGVQLAIPTVCDTRWNSLQMAFAGLLRVRGALRSFAVAYEEGTLPADLKPLEDSQFWAELAKAEQIIRPIAELSFTLERDDVTLAHVFHAIGILFQHLAHIAVTTENPELVNDLAARWDAQEQPLFIIAYVLHPRFTKTALAMIERMRKGPWAVQFSAATISDASEGYFDKWFPDYELNDNDMPISIAMLQFLTSQPFRERLLPANSFNQEKSWWTCYTAWSRALQTNLYPALCKFAMRILALVGQAATQERTFKEFKCQKTAVRNRMSSEAMMKLSVIKQDYSLASKNKVESNGPLKARGRRRGGGRGCDGKSTNCIWKVVELQRVREDQLSSWASGDGVGQDEADDATDMKDEDDPGDIDSVVEQGDGSSNIIEDDIIEEDVMDSGNVLDFWGVVLAELVPEEGDVADQASRNAYEALNVVPAYLTDAEKAIYHNFDFSASHNARVEKIISDPLPDDEDDPNYPQEKVGNLKNFRAAKFPLLYLFGHEQCIVDGVDALPLFPLIQIKE